MKKIICIIMTMMFIIPYCILANATDADWKSYTVGLGGRQMPFLPEDKYVSEQNPPTFTWTMAMGDNVLYNLEIYKDSALTELAYSKYDITNNFYNFSVPFETGQDYYWRVQYCINGSKGSWSDVRRFRIDPDAKVFLLDDINTIVGRIPENHPRIWTTAEKLNEFRGYKDNNIEAKRIYSEIESKAKSYCQSGYIPEEPAKVSPGSANDMLMRLMDCSFTYLISGNAEIGQFAVRLAESLSKWSYETTAPTSYKSQDQVHRAIAYNAAMSYDWLYDLFNTTENEAAKQNVLAMIKGRTEDMIEDGVLTDLKKSPYDSHKWTTFGYIGIIALATHGDIPEADTWFRQQLPLYVALLAPWSYQDGGWSQGTDYWLPNTDQEYMDILNFAGIINLYDTVWIRNQVKWGMYAFPPGSYGSFGDGSGRSKNISAYSDAMSSIANFTGDPVAKWLYEQSGGATSSRLNYYATQNSRIESVAPTGYSLSHLFKDIGWAVMSDSLTDANRIQMTFKSSPYGSYNHSHADQNSFFIQAFGERLAINNGYYDSYNTDHWNHITRPTFSHNSITINNGVGQRDQDFTAKGKIKHFVSQMSFDSVTGDATNAYCSTDNLGKFERNIIYIRPDVFIVVDDLQTKDNSKAEFKWWLNSEREMTVGENWAIISEGKARLRADVIYPNQIIQQTYKAFTDLDGVEWNPGNGYENANEGERVSFATNSTDKTKMVVVMSIYKDSTSAKQPVVEYATDNSYAKLLFNDGTVVVVNLKDNNTFVSTEKLRFKGAAVTYNADSVMLTNGTYLEMNGIEILNSTQECTVVLGCNQLCVSIDSDAELSLSRENQYISIQNEDDLIDKNGRNLTKEVGVVAEISGEYVNFIAQKGEYSLFTNDDTPVSNSGLTPQNIVLYGTDQDSFSIDWDMVGSCEYDIRINETEKTGVKAPYNVDMTDVISDVYSVSVRGRIGGVVGEWSENKLYNIKEIPRYSNVKYSEVEQNGISAIKAELFVSKLANDDIKLITGFYDENSTLVHAATSKVSTGVNTIIFNKPLGKFSKIKSFLWIKNRLIPLTMPAEYKSNDLRVMGIYKDGVLLSDFDDSKDEYKIVLSENQDSLMPNITAFAADNATKVVVIDEFDKMQTRIKLKSSAGKERIITLKYISDKYRVENADSLELFKTDDGVAADENGDQALVSISNVGEFNYISNGLKKNYSIPLYYPSKLNLGEYSFGSRAVASSTRSPKSGNHFEVSKIPGDLVGWSYFVLPVTSGFADMKSPTVKFNLSKPAEVVVISKNALSGLKTEGFKETNNIGAEIRWMNTVTDADIYYNINFNGRSRDDLEGNYIKNYDLAKEWKRVTELVYVASDGTQTKWTAADYDNERPAEGRFTVEGTMFSKGIGTSALNYRYNNIFDKGEVLLDLSGINENVIIIVKPTLPKAFVTNVKYLGAKTYSELPTSMIDNCTDSTSKNPVSFGENTILHYGFDNGALSFYDRTAYVVENLSDPIGIEGAMYMPPGCNFVYGSAGDAWKRAYYLGMGNVSGYLYPGFVDKTDELFSFDLNISSEIYVVTSGKQPEFIDDTWESIPLKNKLFSTMNGELNYNKVYKKYIYVQPGDKQEVIMRTPGGGNRNTNYHLFIKPTAK